MLVDSLLINPRCPGPDQFCRHRAREKRARRMPNNEYANPPRCEYTTEATMEAVQGTAIASERYPYVQLYCHRKWHHQLLNHGHLDLGGRHEQVYTRLRQRVRERGLFCCGAHTWGDRGFCSTAGGCEASLAAYPFLLQMRLGCFPQTTASDCEIT
jgi:hypothetical protein